LIKKTIYFSFVLVFFACYSSSKKEKQTPQNEELIALGKAFFFDTRLSANGTKSCSSCHDPAFAYTDGYRQSMGINADATQRNAPTLLNTRFYKSLTWANPSIKTYQEQMKKPLFAQHPQELGLLENDKNVLEVFRNDTFFQEKYQNAFSKNIQNIDYQDVIKSIAAFENTLIDFSAPYDFYKKGNKNAISEAAIRGEKLFFSKKLNCGKCHSYPLLTNADEDNAFYNIGLYNVKNENKYPSEDEGTSENQGKFRTPTLRNCSKTAPYMHDGSVRTLKEVIQIFENGGQNITFGKNKGDGSKNKYKSDFIKPFYLSDDERNDLINFLNTL
jgi:cytochrome c peroxidase